MNKPKKQEIDKENLIKVLNDLVHSRTAVTHHREIAAWAVAVLYLTSIIAMFKIISDNSKLLFEIGQLYFSIVIILLLFIVSFFIHSQYGSHVWSRSIHNVGLKYLFLLLNDEFDINKLDWKIESDNPFPNFLRSEIIQRASKLHSLVRIGPWTPILWVLFKAYFLLTFWKNRKWKWEIWVTKNYLGEKLQLVESSIYCLLFFITACFLIWINCYNFA